MKEFIIRRASILLFLTLVCVKSFGQKAEFLIPNEAIIQHGGSIGYFSIGAGYELFNNNRGSLDLTYGYVPASKGGSLHIAAVKFAYRPFEIEVGDWGKIFPLNPGAFFSYTFHHDLGMRFPKDQYPKGYYYWSEAFRPHLSFSTEFQFLDGEMLEKTGLKAVTLYSEFNSNDYYLVNFFQSPRELSLLDVFKLGVGMRVRF